MKTWGWFMLLFIGCALAAGSIVLLSEMMGLSFKNTDTGPSSKLIISDDTLRDESTNSQPSAITRSTDEAPADDSASSISPVVNLIRNASFEQDPLTTQPTWETTGLSDDSIAEWTKEQAASGWYALKISSAHPSNKGWPGWLLQLKHQANFSYQVESKYFTPDGANAWLELAFLDGENRLLKGFSTGCPRFSVSGHWTKIQHLVKAEWIPPASRSIRIGLRQCLNHTKGRRSTLYFDDIVLKRFSAAVGHSND